MKTNYFLSLEEQRKVFNYFVGEFEEGVAYISPIPEDVRGSKDHNSSFNIYNNGKGKLVFKDFGSGGISGDAIDFIRLMRDEVDSLKSAIDFYNNRIKMSSIATQILLKQCSESSINKRVKAIPVPEYSTDFTDYELDYWDRLRIEKDLLIEKRIYRLERIVWSNGNYREGSVEGNPAFVWDNSKDGDMSSWKSYYPLHPDKKKKWLSKIDTNVPGEGYFILPDLGDLLIITSSYKDGLVLSNVGYTCFNPSGESAWRKILKSDVNESLRKRFQRIVILFDGDDAGIKSANKFSEESGWEAIHLDYPIIPYGGTIKGREYTKDVTEIVENYSYSKLLRLLRKELNY